MARTGLEEAIRIVLETAGIEGVQALREALAGVGDVSEETVADTNRLLDSITQLNDQAGKASELSSLTDELARTEEKLDSAQRAAYQLTLQLGASEKPSRQLQQAHKAARAEVERLEKAYAAQWSALLKADAALTATGADTRDLVALQEQLRNEVGRTASALERQVQAVRNEATALGQLKQRIAEGDDAFRKQVQSSHAAADSLREYRDRAAAADRATRDLSGGAGFLSRSFGRLTALAGAVTGFFSLQGAFDATKRILGLGDAAELARKRLSRLYGDGGGDQAFERIRTLARDASLEFEQLLEKALKLKSFGLEPLDGTLQGLIDQNAALGGSMETLDGLILGVGQAWAKQKLQGEEILQLVERGVPVWDLLAKATGKNVQELQRLSSAGQLGRKEIRALLEEMAKASEGAAADSVNTLSGLWRGFLDDVKGFARDIASSGSLDWFKEQLRQIRETIARMATDGELQQWAQRVSNAIVSAATAVRDGTVALYEHRGVLLLAAKAYAAFKIGGALVQMNQWRVALMAATHELVRQNTVIGANGKAALKFGSILRSIPTSLKIGVALVGVDLAIRYSERLGIALAKNSEAQEHLVQVQEAMRRQFTLSAAAAAESARGLEEYAHQQTLTAEQVARLTDIEREGYAERLAGLREYLLALNSYYLRMEAAGALTPQLGEQWKRVQEQLDGVRTAVTALGDGARVAGAALKAGIGAGAQEVLDQLNGIDRDAKAASESIKRLFERVNFADSNALGNIGIALDQISKRGAIADRNVRDGLLNTLRQLSGEELLRFQVAAQAAFEELRRGPEETAAVLDSTLLAAMEKLGVSAERVGLRFSETGRQATAAFSAILENANATSAQIETAFRAALTKVATVEEARTLGALLRSAGEQGKVGFDQAERSAAALSSRILQLTNALDPLADEFAALGIQSQASLEATATAARASFDAIRKGAAEGKASVEDVRRAYDAYARTQRALVADSDAAAKSRVESELAVLDAVYRVNDGLKSMGDAGASAGGQVATGARQATQALEQTAQAAASAAESTGAVANAAWEGREGLYGASQGAYTLAAGFGELSKAAVQAYLDTNKAISPLTSGGHDSFFDGISQVTDAIRKQKQAFDAELTSITKQSKAFDVLDERRAQLSQKYSLLGASQIEQMVQAEQQLDQQRKARLEAEARAREEQRKSDEQRVKVLDRAQEVSEATSSTRVPLSDNTLKIELAYPTPTHGGELSPEERRTADRILTYILPKIVQAIARSKSVSVVQRPRR